MVLEVVILGFIVLIVAPILFVSIPLSVSRFMVADIVAMQDLLEHFLDMRQTPPFAKPGYDQT